MNTQLSGAQLRWLGKAADHPMQLIERKSVVSLRYYVVERMLKRLVTRGFLRVHPLGHQLTDEGFTAYLANTKRAKATI